MTKTPYRRERIDQASATPPPFDLEEAKKATLTLLKRKKDKKPIDHVDLAIALDGISCTNALLTLIALADEGKLCRIENTEYYELPKPAEEITPQSMITVESPTKIIQTVKPQIAFPQLLTEPEPLSSSESSGGLSLSATVKNPPELENPPEPQTLDRAEDLLYEHGFKLSGILPDAVLQWEDGIKIEVGDWVIDFDAFYESPNVFALNLVTGRYWFKEIGSAEEYEVESSIAARLLSRSEYDSPGQLDLFSSGGVGITCNRPDAWFNPPEKRDFKAEEGGQLNLLAEVHPPEPPDPDDYPNLQAFEEAWKLWEDNGGNLAEGFEEYQLTGASEIWEQSHSLTFVQELGQGSPSLDCKQDLTSLDSAKLMNIAEASLVSDSQESQFTAMCDRSQREGSNRVTSTSSVLPLPANPSALPENDSEEMTSEIVSQQLDEQLNQSDPNSSVLKTCQDSSVVGGPKDTHLCIFNTSYVRLPGSATMRNGSLSPQPTLERPLLENDCLWLESPGALSSTGNGRPPGSSRLEGQLKSIAALESKEVLNPEFLEQSFSLGIGWTDPRDERSALEFLAAMGSSAAVEPPSEIASIPELQLKPSKESCISTLSSEIERLKSEGILKGHIEEYYVEKCTKKSGKKRYLYYHLVWWDESRKKEIKRHIPHRELAEVEAAIARRLEVERLERKLEKCQD